MGDLTRSLLNSSSSAVSEDVFWLSGTLSGNKNFRAAVGETQASKFVIDERSRVRIQEVMIKKIAEVLWLVISLTSYSAWIYVKIIWHVVTSLNGFRH